MFWRVKQRQTPSWLLCFWFGSPTAENTFTRYRKLAMGTSILEFHFRVLNVGARRTSTERIVGIIVALVSNYRFGWEIRNWSLDLEVIMYQWSQRNRCVPWQEWEGAGRGQNWLALAFEQVGKNKPVKILRRDSWASSQDPACVSLMGPQEQLWL